MDVEKLCNAVAGLPGVEGLGLLDTAGSLHWHTQPGLMGETDPGSIVRELYALFSAAGLPISDVMLEFDQRWLMLRSHGLLKMLIVATDPATVNSTRMMSGLLLRHLEPDALSEWLASRSQAPQALRRASEPEDDTYKQAAPSRPRMYRGQVY